MHTINTFKFFLRNISSHKRFQSPHHSDKKKIKYRYLYHLSDYLPVTSIHNLWLLIILNTLKYTIRYRYPQNL